MSVQATHVYMAPVLMVLTSSPVTVLMGMKELCAKMVSKLLANCHKVLRIE